MVRVATMANSCCTRVDESYIIPWGGARPPVGLGTPPESPGIREIQSAKERIGDRSAPTPVQTAGRSSKNPVMPMDLTGRTGLSEAQTAVGGSYWAASAPDIGNPEGDLHCSLDLRKRDLHRQPLQQKVVVAALSADFVEQPMVKQNSSSASGQDHQSAALAAAA